MTGNASTRVPVLTDRQPWADLIMAGAKDVENRSWPVPSTLPQWTCCVWCATRPELPRQTGMRHLHDSPVGERWWSDAEPYGPFPFRLGIHAGKQVDSSEWAWKMHSREWGRTIGWYREQVVANRLGVLLGFVTVTGCHHADECEKTLCVKAEHVNRTPPFHCSRWAEPGVWHWTLTDPEPLRGPIPMKGRTGLWWTDDPTT